MRLFSLALAGALALALAWAACALFGPSSDTPAAAPVAPSDAASEAGSAQTPQPSGVGHDTAAASDDERAAAVEYCRDKLGVDAVDAGEVSLEERLRCGILLHNHRLAWSAFIEQRRSGLTDCQAEFVGAVTLALPIVSEVALLLTFKDGALATISCSPNVPGPCEALGTCLRTVFSSPGPEGEFDYRYRTVAGDADGHTPRRSVPSSTNARGHGDTIEPSPNADLPPDIVPDSALRGE
jgi:hypothetical protein